MPVLKCQDGTPVEVGGDYYFLDGSIIKVNSLEPYPKIPNLMRVNFTYLLNNSITYFSTTSWVYKLDGTWNNGGYKHPLNIMKPAEITKRNSITSALKSFSEKESVCL